MAEKEVFQKRDIVDVKNSKMLAFGKIANIKGDKAVVHFREPRQPEVCEECGIGIMLSVNASTGEIECLRSGCGHKHGFEERNETIPLSQLINITSIRKSEEKKRIRKDVTAILMKAKKKDILEEKNIEKIIKLLS